MWRLADLSQLSWRHYAALALLCFAFFLPGQMALPPTDRDESRFAQASKQMVETGNYSDIYFQDEPRYKKPIGIYWLQSASANLFHTITGASLNDIWLYRVPSLLAAIGSVLLTLAIGARLFNPTIGLIAALLLASSLLLNVEARLAKTDATLLFTIIAAEYALITVWLKRSSDKWHAALFWLALGAGTLIKGPIILLPVLPTLLLLCWQGRKANPPTSLWRDLRPTSGIILFLLVVLPWFIAITLKSGGAFWQAAAGHDLIGKIKGGQEGHALPPGYYLLTFWATFWPGSIFVFLALPFIWQNRKQEKVLLLLSWIVPTWLVFEAVPTKLLHYTLPTFPALALLAAAALQIGLKPYRWRAVPILGWTIWSSLSLAVMGGLALLPGLTGGDIAYWQCLAAVAGLAGGIWWLARGRQLPPLDRTMALALLGFITLVPVFSLTLPNFKNIWIAPQVQAAITAQEGCRETQLISAAFNEPSLVFLNGTETVLDAKGAAAADWLLQRPIGFSPACRFALVDTKQWPAFTAQLATQQAVMDQLSPIRGFNYSSGHKVDLQLVRLQP